ncbi:MAG: DinB family protein [Chloroflexi bacterium]|nr:DinB family protein [Chloroflexota bacterium]MCC6894782.1 DinB family protein [Anaerolineae bacterium]
MNKQDVIRLFDYNFWANRKLWACVEKLSASQFDQPTDYSIGSVHEQVVHMLEVEWLWLRRVQSLPPDTFQPAAHYPTYDSIRSRWDRVEAAWREYLHNLPDGDLDGILEYTSRTDSKVYRTPLWESLYQILNHSTDHRSQTLAQIHRVGGETLPQDFIYYTWEKPSGA